MLLIMTLHTCAAFTLKPLLCLFTLAAEVGCVIDEANSRTTLTRIR
jgi:hypothetical protein